MAKVITSFRTAASDSLMAVSNSVNVISKAASSASLYMDQVEAHAGYVSATVKASYQYSTEEINAIARDKARMRMAQHRVELQSELKDPAFAEMFNSIKFDDEIPAAPKAVA